MVCSIREGLRFLDAKCDWVMAAVERVLEQEAERARASQSIPADLRALRQRALQALPPQVANLAAQHGFTFRRVTIRAARSRWGSCSARNDISLSTFLVLLPPHLQKFVILHELCHTRIKNHSAAFHSLLDSLVGGSEKELNKELRRYRPAV